jgi:acetyl-CoA synthetase
MAADPLNVAATIFRRHEDGVTRLALIEARPSGNNSYTYGSLDYLSNKFANALAGAGLRRGDPVAVSLPQSAATAITHLAALKLGAVLVPLSPALSPATFDRALREAKVRAVVAGASFESSLDESLTVFTIEDDGGSFWRAVDAASSDFSAAVVGLNATAFVFYPAGEVISCGAVIEQLSAGENSHRDVMSEALACEDSDWYEARALFGKIYSAWWNGRAVFTGGDARG